MMKTNFVQKLQKVGNSTGVVIPKSVLDALNLTTGDVVSLSLDDKRVIFEPGEGDFSRFMAAEEECNQRYGRALAALAK